MHAARLLGWQRGGRHYDDRHAGRAHEIARDTSEQDAPQRTVAARAGQEQADLVLALVEQAPDGIASLEDGLARDLRGNGRSRLGKAALELLGVAAVVDGDQPQPGAGRLRRAAPRGRAQPFAVGEPS